LTRKSRLHWSKTYCMIIIEFSVMHVLQHFYSLLEHMQSIHRPFKEVMLNSSFIDILFTFSSSEILFGKKPGSLGSTSSISLTNIWIMDVMVGLSSGYCCTHKRLTWMHRSASVITHESFTFESIKSKAFFSFQSSHA